MRQLLASCDSSLQPPAVLIPPLRTSENEDDWVMQAQEQSRIRMAHLGRIAIIHISWLLNFRVNLLHYAANDGICHTPKLLQRGNRQLNKPGFMSTAVGWCTQLVHLWVLSGTVRPELESTNTLQFFNRCVPVFPYKRSSDRRLTTFAEMLQSIEHSQLILSYQDTMMGHKKTGSKFDCLTKVQKILFHALL